MLLLLDRNENFISSLPYNDPVRKREINGLNTFEVETSKEVEDGQRLVFKDSLGKWNEYIIYDHFKSHDKDGVSYEVYAEDSTSELYGTYIDDFKPRKAKATAILAQILENTRFEVGRVDDFEVQSFNLYHTNAKKALWTILEKYGAEIQVRIEVQDNKIIHRYIDLKKRIGFDTGKRFTYKKDTQDIKKTTSTKNLATKIYVYGKGEEVVDENGHSTGGYGRKINFAEINGGKKYLEDEEARLLYGYGKERKHIEATVEFSDCEDKAELLELGKKALKEMSKPEITYELKVEDISRYDGYIGEGVDLGDTVLVIDKEIDLRVQTRVVSITDNPLEEIKDSEIVLGNFIRDLSENQTEYEKLKNQLENRNQSLYDELQKLAEGVEGSYIDSVVERFNEELNSTGGWVYAEKGEGIIILNAPRESGNATQAIKLAGGIIGIANSKKSNGDFDYRTFGDGNGFTADLIVAGILKGGKVHWNLEDGTLLIGESTEDYSLWWDGVTLHLRGVDIDLENNDTIQGIKQQFIIAEGNVASAIQSVREDTIELNNTTLQTISENYSTIVQTDKKIESVVSQTNEILKGYSTISQTSDAINLEVKSLQRDIDDKVDTNGIISAINLSPERIQIDSDRLDIDVSKLELNVNEVTTTWSRYSSKKAIHIGGPSIELYNKSGDVGGGIHTGHWVGTSINNIRFAHYPSDGTMTISYYNGSDYTPYITFDKYSMKESHPITVNEDVDIGTNNIKIGRSGKAFLIETINYSNDTALRFKWTDGVWFEYRKSGSLYMRNDSGVKKVFSID